MRFLYACLQPAASKSSTIILFKHLYCFATITTQFWNAIRIKRQLLRTYNMCHFPSLNVARSHRKWSDFGFRLRQYLPYWAALQNNMKVLLCLQLRF